MFLSRYPSPTGTCLKIRHYLVLLTALLAAPLPALAAEELVEEVVVWGRAIDLMGTADSASQGVVGYADFSTRPIMRVGELVEVVPGMIATQHSGPGKANQYFLRGMNLDYGSDFSARFDGMPVNMRSHAHATGYLDLNFMFPEIIETVEYRKGPYYADVGDFSAAGGAAFKTYDRLDQNFAEFQAGTEDDYRFVGGYGHDLGGGDLILAVEYFVRDGPWVLEQDLNKVNALVKYTRKYPDFDVRLSALAYDAEWNSTNQIPLRAVENGSTPRFGFIDPDLGGDSSRYSLIASASSENFDISAYVSYYEMNLINNPTYFLNDPVNGDEFEQEDQRWIYGLTATYPTEVEIAGYSSSPRIGLEVRYDDVSEVNLFNTVARRRIGTVREDTVEELSISLFGDIEVNLSDRLRATLGLRWDYFDFEVDALRLVNSGSDSDSLLQPKFGLGYAVSDRMEIYANYGIGFHSNDVRGAVIAVDPVTGAAADSVDTLVEAEGAEAGIRTEFIDGLVATLAAFWLELDSELLFVGDAGTSEPNEATRRYGVELAAFWNVNDWLVLDVAVTKTEGEFKGLPDGEDHIPDAHGFTASAGVTVLTGDGWTGSLRLRHFGDAPLTKDDSVSKDASTLVNLGVSRKLGDFELGLEVLNLLDTDEDDIAYFFESQLAGEPQPVEGIHFHPAEERAIKVSIKYAF